MKRKRTKITLLGIVFFASGFSSLIYQVAWQRILTLYYSVENISTTLIVCVYMLGLGLGAIIGGKLAEQTKHKIGLYFAIELLIGLFGYISLPFLEFLGRNTAGSGYVVSSFCMFSFLSIPTLLMGMTLPLLTKIFNGIVHNFLRSISYLYFINTIGASVGALVTSFLFISFWGLDTSIYIAAAINISIALLTFFNRHKFDAPVVNTASSKTMDEAEDAPPPVSQRFDNVNTAFFIVFITGFVAIGYEIIWFRLLSVIVKASPYAFSSILFVYLMGIALGSYLMNRRLRNNTTINKKNLFFILQVALALFVLLSVTGYYLLVKHVPIFNRLSAFSFGHPLHPPMIKPSAYTPYELLKWMWCIGDIIFWPMIFVLVPTMIMGASFPLITSISYKNNKEGASVGSIYFYNILGNVAGGLATGFVFLHYMGTEYSLLTLSLIGLLFIFFTGNTRFIPSISGKLIFFITTVIAFFLAFPGKEDIYFLIHNKPIYNVHERKIIEEGVDGVVALHEHNDSLSAVINGTGHGGRPYVGFYYEADIALSYRKEINNALVIGFGTGSTVEALLKLNPQPQITLVELSETLIKALDQIEIMKQIIHHKNVKLIYADGRKFLYNCPDKFDAILMDPLISSTSYSNNIYSKEFFTLIKEHLNPGGVTMCYTDEPVIIPKTIASVFADMAQYNYFCIASNSKLNPDNEKRDLLFTAYDPIMQEALRDHAKKDSLKSYPISRAQVLAETRMFPINEDYKPRCEYYIGMKVLRRTIYDEGLLNAINHVNSAKP